MYKESKTLQISRKIVVKECKSKVHDSISNIPDELKVIMCL